MSPLFLTLLFAPRNPAVVWQARMIALERRLPHARLGVSVVSLDRPYALSFRGTERFPLQSVFKLPLGAVVLEQVRAGRMALDDPVTIGPGDLSLSHAPVSERYRRGERRFTLRELVRSAGQESDNTAADALLNRLGGAPRVDRYFRTWSGGGVRLDRTERQLQMAVNGLTRFTPALTTEAGLTKALAALPAERRARAFRRALRDPRDSATPVGSTTLLRFLAARHSLDDPRPDSLWNLSTSLPGFGQGRMTAGWPAGSRFWRKTGTGHSYAGRGLAVNEIGVVRLPSSAPMPRGERLAIAVYLSGAGGTREAREAVLADVARATWAALRTPSEK